MNVNNLMTTDYVKKDTWWNGKNEPKTNPIYRGVASGEAGSEAKNDHGGDQQKDLENKDWV